MSSWFHRLRRKTAGAGAIASAAAVAETPAPPPCSPNRASYYVPSRDRDRALAVPRRPAAAAAAREDNPKLRDTRFPPRSPPQPSPSDIVFDVVVAARRDDRFSAFAAGAAPELKLRPILTRPPPRLDAGSSSAAASPTGRARPSPRFHFDAAKGGGAAAAAPEPDHHHMRNKEKEEEEEEEEEGCTRSQRQSRSRSRRRRLRRGGGRLRWVYESVVVVKESADPEEDFLESMAEMIAANDGVRSPRGLEELLACYLALNAADHHRAIVAAFRRAWLQLHLHLHRAPPPTPERGWRCMHEHESCVVVVD